MEIESTASNLEHDEEKDPMNQPPLWRDPTLEREIERLELRMEELKEQVSKARYDAALEVVSTEPEVRAVIAERRTREAIFGGELFADPAWDMLLELYASYLGRRSISVSKLVAASVVPATTALRWIDKLDSDGLAVRTPDPKDRRKVCVELSNEGLTKMRSYFAAVRSGISPGRG